MIDREKVINGLEHHLKELSVGKTCFQCPYCGNNPCEIHLVCDTLELLKTDQYYLQKLTERLQRIADIAGDYDNYPTRNGLEWVCIEIQEIAMHGLQEVKDENT